MSRVSRRVGVVRLKKLHAPWIPYKLSSSHFIIIPQEALALLESNNFCRCSLSKRGSSRKLRNKEIKLIIKSMNIGRWKNCSLVGWGEIHQLRSKIDSTQFSEMSKSLKTNNSRFNFRIHVIDGSSLWTRRLMRKRLSMFPPTGFWTAQTFLFPKR